jgi:pimeloyl-ACP methyl ester carboxylesterase
VRQLITRGAIDPARTILAGHSMGGAIAVGLARGTPCCGNTIAISRHRRPPLTVSPLPCCSSMILAHAGHTLVLETFIPRSVRDTARRLIAGSAATTGKYIVIPRSTHVSLLFDPAVVRASQMGRAGLEPEAKPGPASRLSLSGSLRGWQGFFCWQGPFCVRPSD